MFWASVHWRSDLDVQLSDGLFKCKFTVYNVQLFPPHQVSDRSHGRASYSSTGGLGLEPTLLYFFRNFLISATGLHFVLQARDWSNMSTGGRQCVQSWGLSWGLLLISHRLRTVMLLKFNGWFRQIALVNLVGFIFIVNCFGKISSHFTQINSQDAMTHDNWQHNTWYRGKTYWSTSHLGPDSTQNVGVVTFVRVIKH